MNTFLSRTISALAAAATLLLGNNAFATAWGDSSTSTGYVYLTNTNFGAPTVLRTVTVKCPKAGRLMAYAGANFTLYSAAYPYRGRAGVGISITQTTSADANHYHLLDQYLSNVVAYVPAVMQRTDTCTAGQTVTYRFVAWRYDASEYTSAEKPQLDVIFVDTII